jgi:hypothetical protein
MDGLSAFVNKNLQPFADFFPASNIGFRIRAIIPLLKVAVIMARRLANVAVGIRTSAFSVKARVNCQMAAHWANLPPKLWDLVTFWDILQPRVRRRKMMKIKLK